MYRRLFVNVHCCADAQFNALSRKKQLTHGLTEMIIDKAFARAGDNLNANQMQRERGWLAR